MMGTMNIWMGGSIMNGGNYESLNGRIYNEWWELDCPELITFAKCTSA